MPDDPWNVRATLGAASLTDFAVSRGMSRSDALAGSGITESDLHDPDVEINRVQEYPIIRNILANSGNEPGLGLMAGMAIHVPMLGSIGVALSTCATAREMIEMWARYASLSFVYLGYTVEEVGSQVWLTLDPTSVPEELRRFAIERELAALRSVQRDILNWDLPVQRLEVIFEWNPVYEAVGLLLSIPDITFDMPATKLVFEAADLERALPQANSVLCRQHEQICDEILQHRHKRTGLSGRVRELLVRHRGLADQDEIAAELNISARSLRRRLAEEGTTFRELTLETTGTLAEELLSKGCTVDAVAHRLGYASISAFTAAFRTWSGQTPGQFARAHQYTGRDARSN